MRSKESLLKDLSEMEYVFYMNRTDLSVGSHGLLLCFKDGSVDIRYVLYCRHKFTVIYQTETDSDSTAIKESHRQKNGTRSSIGI